jgi:hypothetical protein
MYNYISGLTASKTKPITSDPRQVQRLLRKQSERIYYLGAVVTGSSVVFGVVSSMGLGPASELSTTKIWTAASLGIIAGTAAILRGLKY